MSWKRVLLHLVLRIINLSAHFVLLRRLVKGLSVGLVQLPPVAAANRILYVTSSRLQPDMLSFLMTHPTHLVLLRHVVEGLPAGLVQLPPAAAQLLHDVGAF